MRRFLAAAVLAAVAWPARADENEAEKLFRATEQKVRAAKAVRVRCDLDITDAAGNTGKVKGTLVLGEGDRFRVEADGKAFGQVVKGTEVSDGTTRKVIGPDVPKEDKAQSPKGLGEYFRAALLREGFFGSTLHADRRDDKAAMLAPSDFQLVGEEKVGDRNTRVIRYKLGGKGGDGVTMKLWLDAETNLPVKRQMTGGKSDVGGLTETYTEFAIDPKLDPKTFSLSK